MGIKNYALFFTHRSGAVASMREMTGDMDLISKIESIVGVLNIKEFLALVDQILISRGNLLREIPIEQFLL